MKMRVLSVALIMLLLGTSIALQLDRSSLQRASAMLQEQITVLHQRIASLEQEVGVWQQKSASLEEKLQGALPYSKADGTPITLQNNYGEVSNPTWGELKAFLEGDDTANIRYCHSTFLCGDFAERLHNNAESEGVRAGVAIVYFEGQFTPHALNVFYTLDRGLVFIDPVGTRTLLDGHWEEAPFGLGRVWRQAEGEDKIAYVVEGKEYGLIPVDVASCFTYEYYVRYVERWKEYNRRIDAHNADVAAYNAALGGRVYLQEPEYSRFVAWYNDLERERLEVERLRLALGDYWYEPLGIVREIEIYWNAMKWEEQNS